MINDKLAIVVGHTDDNSGASMADPYSYIQEYEYNTVLAGVMSCVLKKRGVDNFVVLRDGIGIEGAYQVAANRNPAAIIELHFNSTLRSDVKGTETLHGNIAGSKELARLVHLEICELFGRKLNGGGDRGLLSRAVSDRGGKSLNNGHSIPTIMVEPFFGSSVLDCEQALLNIVPLAEAIIDGYMSWLLAMNEPVSGQH